MTVASEEECLGTDVLTGLLAGDLGEVESAQVERHIDRCPACAELVAHLARSPLLEQRTAPSEPVRGSELAPGDSLGRFGIVRELGRGGMGVVYLADDPKLERRVALKVLRPTPEGSTPGQRDHTLREARALARLSHPNVVAIFDLGAHGDDVFIAMEYLDGPTLREWVREKPRSWREVARAYLEAGRGLAAAHAEGLVHRDFKPTNVLVAGERVVVLDFGLAHVSVTAPSGDFLQRPGTIVGTPAYMAPEQRDGAEVDARSDQFSFCVALFEAVYGVHPLLRDRQTLPRVSAPLRRALERGLSNDPQDRFSSMRKLLSAIDAAVRRRRRAWWVASAVVGVALAGFAVPSADSRCRETPPEVAAAWNDERKAEVRASFEDTGASFASTAFAALAPELDRWSATWHDAYEDACAATHLRAEQSERELEGRMLCLRRAHRRFVALVELLRVADTALVARSVEAAGDLPTLSACIEATPVPPESHGLRAANEALARADALRLAARWEDAEEEVKLAGREGDALTQLGARVLMGRILVHKGDLEAGRTELEEALWAAEAQGAHALSAEAANALTWLYASSLLEPDSARRFATISETAVERLGGDSALTSDRLRNLGWVEFKSGRPEAAKEYFEAAQVYVVAGSRDEIILRNDLGATLVMSGSYEEGQRHLEAVVADAEALLGVDHPDIALVLNNLAAAQRERGELEASLRTYRRIYAAFAANGGGFPFARVALNLGTVLADLDRLDEAAASFEEALNGLRESVGDDHPDVARAHDGLASVKHDSGDYDGAIAGFERALVIKEAALGPDHPGLVVSLANLGMSHVSAGRPAEALAPLDRAVALLEASFGANHPSLAVVLTGRGSAYRDLGQLDLARIDLERAIAIAKAHDSPVLSQAEEAIADLGSTSPGMDPG